MALLAYKEPENSPMFHLLSLDYRQEFADNLNRTILGWLTWLYSLYIIYIWLQISIHYFTPIIYYIWCIIVVFFFHWRLAAYFNLPSYTAMERLVQQATVVRQCLNEESGKVIGNWWFPSFISFRFWWLHMLASFLCHSLLCNLSRQRFLSNWVTI